MLRSLVGSEMCIRDRYLCRYSKVHFWRDSCGSLSSISFNQPPCRGQNLSPTGAVVRSPLAPWHHGRRLRWAVRPESAILTCCAPGGAAIWAACAQNGRDGLQDAPASLLEQSKPPTPPTRVPRATVQAFLRGSNLFHFFSLSHPQASPESKKLKKM